MQQRSDDINRQIGESNAGTQPVNVTGSLARFHSALDRAFALVDAQHSAMRHDFTQGITTLTEQGMPFTEVLQRLDPARLNGFYAEQQQGFYPLDNAAKQYPLVMSGGQMAMFRLTATLDAPVEPALLQLALTFTLRRFPHYATRMRRGAFWYYLKPCLARYAVIPDSGTVCKAIDVSDEANPLFRVLYRDCRVSVELFHILSDGMGGLIFLKSLLGEYYRLQGEDNAYEDAQVLDSAMSPHPDELANGFTQFQSKERGKKLLGAPAVQLAAERLPAGECCVDQFTVSAVELKQAAGAYGVTVTTLMSAIILTACRQTARKTGGCYRLQVTMDLRRVFGRRTLRNFSWFDTLNMDAKTTLTKMELVSDLQRQILTMTERDTLEKNVSVAQQMIRWLKYVPLQWKTAVMRTAYRMTGDYFFTSTLSNLGVIALDTPLQAHVWEIAAVLGPSVGNPYVFALATANGKALLSVTRTTDDTQMLDMILESARSYGLDLKKKGSLQ